MDQNNKQAGGFGQGGFSGSAPRVARNKPVMDIRPAPRPVSAPISSPKPQSRTEPKAFATPIKSKTDTSLPLKSAAVVSPTRTMPIFAIIMALIVAGLLTALMLVAFARSQGAAKPTAKKPAATNTANNNGVTSKDVDNTTTNIDKNLSAIDDKKDLNSADLSDQTLGL
jgi:hypothetical protein